MIFVIILALWAAISAAATIILLAVLYVSQQSDEAQHNVEYKREHHSGDMQHIGNDYGVMGRNERI